MVPRETQTDFRGNPMANVGSGTVLQNGANSFYLIAQGGVIVLWEDKRRALAKPISSSFEIAYFS